MASKKSAKDASEVNAWLARIKHAEKIRNEADEKYGYTRSLKQYQGDYR